MSVNPVTGLVLAGGQGSRMGGVDKGLQSFHGQPLALNALQRLGRQQGHRLSGCLINANRHLDVYAGWGAPVWPDTLTGYAGPLAGFLVGLAHCTTPWLLTVPCDSPLFPLDLLERLAIAAEREGADIALAAAREEDGQLRTQPVFCLLHTRLRPSLQDFIESGQRKIETWTRLHPTAIVPFDLPNDDPRAFCNANTLAELRALEEIAP
jgi:molybdenum cofactor guanylyltransferase